MLQIYYKSFSQNWKKKNVKEPALFYVHFRKPFSKVNNNNNIVSNILDMFEIASLTGNLKYNAISAVQKTQLDTACNQTLKVPTISDIARCIVFTRRIKKYFSKMNASWSLLIQKYYMLIAITTCKRNFNASNTIK